MASGFFLGGAAEGMKDAAELGIKRDTLAQDLALKTRGLDIQQQSSDRGDRRLGQELSLKTRALDLTEQAQKNAVTRDILVKADKSVSDTMTIISETIDAGLAAGRDPAVIAKTIQPLLQSAKSISSKAGLDPNSLDIKVQTWMAKPTAAEKAVGEVKTKISAADAVSKATGVPQREALQGQGVLKAEPKPDKILEDIRNKIARGEALSTGEERVYSDAVHAEGNKLLSLMKGLGVLPQQPTAPATAPTTASAPSAGTQPVPPAYKGDPDGSEYRKDKQVWVKQGDKLVLKK